MIEKTYLLYHGEYKIKKYTYVFINNINKISQIA